MPPDTTETLTMLREAFGLGLLPDGWKFSDVAPDDVIYDNQIGDVAHTVGGKWVVADVALHPLLDHLTSPPVDLRVIREPSLTAKNWTINAPWWQVVPVRVGTQYVEGGVPYFGEPANTGILGLLAAAVEAETWRRAREAEVRNAT